SIMTLFFSGNDAHSSHPETDPIQRPPSLAPSLHIYNLDYPHQSSEASSRTTATLKPDANSTRSTSTTTATTATADPSTLQSPNLFLPPSIADLPAQALRELDRFYQI